MNHFRGCGESQIWRCRAWILHAEGPPWKHTLFKCCWREAQNLCHRVTSPTSRWSRLFREHWGPRIASYLLEGWVDMPQGTSKNLIGLTNSHTYKNGCFLSHSSSKLAKALPTMLSHELFFFFARIAEQARTSSTLRCSHSWSYQWHLCGECITLSFQRWRLGKKTWT